MSVENIHIAILGPVSAGEINSTEELDEYQQITPL
jgi:hypothetical protein